MSKPTIAPLLTGFLLNWEEEGAAIKVTHIKEKSDEIKGEIDINVSLPGYRPHVLHCTFNFSSLVAREKLIKTCSVICKDILWNQIIEQLRVYVIRAYRQGEVTLPLVDIYQTESVNWLIEPLIYKDVMNVIYGDGGCGKSTLALFLSGLLSVEDIPYTYNGFTIHRTSKVLYLDWECEGHIMANMYRKMYDRQNTLYRRCNIPLNIDLEQIASVIDSENINVIIIDSLGLSTGGDLNDAASANVFASAVRKLKCTTIVIAHNAKNTETGTKTIYGSVYFHNNARNVWEVKNVQEEGDNKYQIGLFHRKCNLGKLQQSIFLDVYHSDEMLSYIRTDSTIDFEKHMPISHRIKDMLKIPQTAKQLSDELNISDGIIRKELQRLKIKDQINKNDQNQWFLIYK